MSHRQVRTETSIIARARPGTNLSLGFYGTAMVITEAFEKYQDILSIGFSHPNFVVGLGTLEAQLDAIACRTIQVPEITLDLVIWSSEYESFDLPWIIGHDFRAITPKRSDNYINHLVGQPQALQQYVSNVILGQYSCRNTRDEATGESATTAYMIRTNLSVPTNAAFHNILSVTPLKRLRSDVPDFSYLMILELKNFYRTKYDAFRKCVEFAQAICDCAHHLCVDIKPKIKTVRKQIESISYILALKTRAALQTFSADLKAQKQEIVEQISGLDKSIACLCNAVSSPISLTKFRTVPPSLIAHDSGLYTVNLKSILESVVQHIYRTSVIISTTKIDSGNLKTEISGNGFHDEYVSCGPVPKSEAEADAIYSFLRHKTNVLGYNIIDTNYSALANLVSEIDRFNQEVNHLLVHATKAVRIVNEVYSDISRMNHRLTTITSDETISELNASMNDIVICAQAYSVAIDNGLQALQRHKQAYASIRHVTRHRSVPKKVYY